MRGLVRWRTLGQVTVVAGPSINPPPHVLMLHRQELHRQARAVSWVRQGLARGEKILYSTVPGDTLVPALRTGASQVTRALRRGQLSFIPATEFFPGARQTELVNEAFEEGYPAVRLSARAEAALVLEPLAEYEVIDGLMDELSSTSPVSVLCQLDLEAVGSETLRALIGCHAGVIEDVQMRLRRRDEQVILAGEVDFGSAAVLAEALRCLCQVGAAPATVIDLSGLTFLDVSGCRALVIGTDELRRAGGSVTFLGASEHLRKVMCLVGMDRMPGLELP